MSKNPLLQKLEKEHLNNKATPDFHIGDTVRVHVSIVEGEKKRVQIYTGTVIARKGHGLSETFSVHRVAYGEGMERVFLTHSPNIGKIEVTKHGRVRRGKLYYLRGTSGKKSKVEGRIGGRRPGQTTNNIEETVAIDKEATGMANESTTAANPVSS